MLSIPRALPPVTHSSALQAPECMWGIIRGRTIHRTGVYSCLSPCDGCKTRKGDDGAGRKYSSLLEDFQTGTASMARKRHLASSARGLFGLCLMTQIEVQKVQEVQEVQWVQIRPIRGRIEIHRTGFLRCLSYGQPHTRHKSVPSVAEQLSIERVLISILSGFFILHYTAKMGI